ncbi:histidine phosphatase family protein [Cupriavidus metallidurans]|jgi:phosphohistidine phosphatase|uniref:Histidine phosphatase family protein n=1 Tax=Cupriavidus metallidurans TaxID=119219 RepID=A0A482IMP9_9BURK|nr:MULTISPECIES: histidine phosphatase family protein [Cupriavidus]MCE7700067.1 histidine phosphatase family protein [Methanobacterium paludis]HBO82007.1 histidine phosphatase family protein [Cupriavidus sp.]ELA01066.1 phosphohistidine phosphatase SixA [Cupriavidus sp. HMR-1]KWR83089.1 histidine phosphatase family protein [Cupriavidus sp. SHE]QBP10335.1 histidine phosphatase family protein [Cupriavidus metallidurans]
MNLILWRHAEAEDLPDVLSISRSADLQRPLTRRGRKQAESSAAWLRARLPADYRVVCSPALRTRETAAALTGKAEILDELAPGADVGAVLAAIDWPQGHEYTVVVGHQPWIGQLASLLLAGQEINWSVKKSGIWWLTARTRESEAQVVLRAVIPPELL